MTAVLSQTTTTRAAVDERTYELTTSQPLYGSKLVELKDTTTDRVVWRKTRALTDDEILDTVYDASLHARWTIHRPLRGWYLILRQVDADVEVELEPLVLPGSEGGGFEFEIVSAGARREGGEQEEHEQEEKKEDNDPAEEEHVRIPIKAPPTTKTKTNRFVVRTGRDASCQPQSGEDYRPSLITNWLPHFLGGGGGGKSFSCSWVNTTQTSRSSLISTSSDEQQVMHFIEHRSILSTTTAGTLYLSPSIIDDTGVEPSFWASLAMAVLEYLEDKEGWEAAKGGG